MEFDDIRISIPLNAIQKNNILINKQNEKSGILLLLPLKYTPYMYRLEPVKSGKKDTEKSDMKQVRYEIPFSVSISLGCSSFQTVCGFST